MPKSAYNDLKDAELSDLESSASDSGSEPVVSRFQVRNLVLKNGYGISSLHREITLCHFTEDPRFG